MQQLHDRKRNVVLAAKVVDSENVRVRKGRNALGFTFKTGVRLGVVCQMFGEDLHGNLPFESGIQSAVHLTHTARAEKLADRIGAEIRTVFEFHVTMPLRDSISWYTIEECPLRIAGSTGEWTRRPRRIRADSRRRCREEAKPMVNVSSVSYLSMLASREDTCDIVGSHPLTSS